MAPTTRIVLVGEGDLSHGSFLRRTADALGQREGVNAEARIVEAPGSAVGWRLIAPIARLGDFDLQPLRWRLRYSWCARRLLDSQSADVALVNTQSVALLAAGPMRRIPTVVSVDVTGRQFAALEYWRPHRRTALASELPLQALERRAFHHAAGLLAWSEWTARSLRDDYGVPAERIAVVHPGVDVNAWDVKRPPTRATDDGLLRVLFVGNFAARKGLPTLVAALPQVGRPVELHIVTNDERVDAPAEVLVHRGLKPGSEQLRRRFAEADVFAFPTRADAVPWVVAEAMAAGLPVVATDVAAIPEMLNDTGIVVPRDDAAALAGALRQLADDPARRAALGARAHTRAHERFAQDRQLGRIVEVLDAARQRHAGGLTA